MIRLGVFREQKLFGLFFLWVGTLLNVAPFNPSGTDIEELSPGGFYVVAMIITHTLCTVVGFCVF